MQIRHLLIGLAAACAAALAQAESADRNKPIEIVANHFDGDEIKQVAIYTGNVEVHQGTMEILGNKLQLVISPEGYRTLTVWGNPVRMKERRDPKTKGIDEWVHASSLVAVYEEQKDIVTLIDVAKLARSENGLVKDSTEGDKIIYNLRTARSYVEGKVVEGKRSRVSTVLAPRPKNKQSSEAQAPKSGARAPLSGSPRLEP